MHKLAGDDLRDSIAQLLRMKFQTVEVERRLRTTTADVFFIDDTNPIFPRTIAIEAKDWKHRLTSEDIASIYNLYSPSLSDREIDFVWLVGRHPLSSSPKHSLDSLRGLKYSTFDEFRSSLMNFTGMMQNNILLFEHDDASKYFVETRVRNSDVTLFQHVTNWLSSEQNGLIVYGGYGLGKTTFSLHLAAILSKRQMNGEFDRIPIRIALGGMYSKQDLIALICAALSGGEGGAPVKDFSYGLFLEMNRQGQYLLILDGFDEMRHAMDLDDFVYTFEQMKPLFAGKAKVIILGRPDSFLSSQEEEQVLTALFDEGGERNRRLDTVEVSFFSRPEVLGYLDHYLKNRSEKLTQEQQNNYAALMARLPDSEESILSRPVQLKMFTKVIEECLASSALLNRYGLYRRFIYYFITREAQKAARRQMIGPHEQIDLKDDRATFMQEVAWWLLNTKKENRFLAEDIPVELIPASIRAGRNTASAVREAIVGSVIEPISTAGVLGSKAKRYYYFPHKSYLEFLVANFFQRSTFSVEMYREFLKSLNNEILIFLEEGPKAGIKSLRQGLSYHLRAVDYRIMEVCIKDDTIQKEIVDDRKSNRHPSRIYAHYLYLRAGERDPEQYLLARVVDSTTLDSVLATFVCIANELADRGNANLARAFVLNCLTSVSAHNIRSFIERGERSEVFRADSEGLRALLISECILRGPKGRFVIDVEGLYSFLQRASRASFHVDVQRGEVKNRKLSIAADTVAKAAGEAYTPIIKALAEIEPRRGGLCPVEARGQALDRFMR